jgi:hypothetical protein
MNFNNIRKQVSDFRDRLSAYIDTLPDGADGVHFLNKEKTCGTVNFSTMQANKGIMSACYYLNHTAKEEIKHIIKVTKLENLDTVIKKIIQTGSIPGRQPVKTNPQFISKIKEMWEEQCGK